MQLVSDKRVFEGFEMDARLRVPVDVKVGDVWLKRRADFARDGIPNPSDAHPFPQLTLLLNKNTHGNILIRSTPLPCYTYSHGKKILDHPCFSSLSYSAIKY